MSKRSLITQSRAGVNCLFFLATLMLVSGCSIRLRAFDPLDLTKEGVQDAFGNLEFSAIDPGAAGNDLTPSIFGTSTVSVHAVRLYSDAACTVEIGTGSATEFRTTGIGGTVLPNVSTQIYAQARQNNGVIASPCVFMTGYLHDSIPPVITLTTPTSGAIINAANVSSVTFAGTCSENGRTVSIGGSAIGAVNCVSGSFSVALDLSSLADGAHSFTASQSDFAANTATTAPITVTKDVTLPVVTISSPASGAFANISTETSFPVSGSCSENGRNVALSGVATSSVTCTGGAWSANLNVSALGQGSFTLNANLSDAAGNVASAASRSFVKDTVVPTVAITSPTAGTLINSGGAAAFTMSGTCSENTRTVAISGALTTSATCTSGAWTLTMDLTSVADGSLTFVANFTDAAGNAATASARSFTKDVALPTVTITSPIAGAYIHSANVASFAISGTCSENGRNVTLSGDAAGTVTCTAGAWSTNLDFSSAGQGSVTVRADHTDASGNSGSQAARAFTKDTVLPTLTISGPAAASVISAAAVSSFAVSGTCSETGETVVISGDAAATVSCLAGAWNANLNFTGASDGNVSITVNHADAATNPASSVTRSFAKDVSLPTVAITSPSVGAWINAANVAAFTVSGTCSENSRTVTLSGAAAGSATCTAGAWSLALDFSAAAQGSITLLADQSDASGNAATQAARLFAKDTVAPSVAITAPSAGSIINSANMGAFNLSGTCSEDGRNVVLSGADAATVVCASGVWSAVLDVSASADGPLAFTVNHVDSAGNPATPDSRSFTKASAPGGSDTLSINANANFTNSTSVTLTLHSDNYTDQMYVTNVAGCASGGSWAAYGTSLAWTLGQTNGTATVYVKYQDAFANVSACISDTITHDSVLPTVAITSPAGGSYANAANESAFVVSGTCSESGRQVVIGGVASTTANCASGVWSVTLDVSGAAQGSFTVTADHADAATNSATQATRNFVKDTVFPVTTITAVTNGGLVNSTNQSSITVSGTCSENGRNVSISSPAGTPSATCTSNAFTATLDFSAQADGTSTISVNADDAAGNAASVSTTVTKDTSPPTVAISTPALNSWINLAGASAVTVTGTCSENTRNVVFSGAASGSVACTAGTFTQSLDFSAAADGTVTLNANHSDANGNVATQATRTFVKDTVIPTLAISSPAAGSGVNATNKAAFTVTGTCSENTRNVVISGSASATVTCTSLAWTANLDFSGVADGAVSIQVNHTDAAGNAATQISRNFVKDTGAPYLDFTTPSANSYFTGPNYVPLTGACLDAGQTVTISGAFSASAVCDAFGNWSTSTTLSGMAEGPFSLTASISDSAGNTTTVTNGYHYDSIAPILTVTTPTAGAFITPANASAFHIEGACDEPGAHVYATIGAVTQDAVCTSGAYAMDVDFSAVADGAHTLNVSVRDAALNAANVNIALVKDVSAPTVAITSPAANSYLNAANVASVAVSGTCSENGRNVVISGTASGTVTCTGNAWSTNLDFSAAAEGSGNLLADHSDAAGNTATQASRAFDKDTVLPTVGMTYPVGGENLYAGSTANILFIATDAGSGIPTNSIAVAYSTDNAGSWNSLTTTQPNSGTYAWTIPGVLTSQGLARIIATDRAGNARTTVSAAPFNIKLPPLLTWAPASREHGPVAVNQESGNFSFTLTNSGTGIAECTSGIQLSGDTADFIVTTGCTATTIAVGASCTFNVKAAPLSTGSKTLTMTKTCGHTGAVVATAMTTAVNASATLSWVGYSTIDLGYLRAGQVSRVQPVYFQNLGNGAATCSAPTLVGDSAQFTLTDIDCGTNTLAAGANCSALVQATPSSISGFGNFAILRRNCGGVDFDLHLDSRPDLGAEPVALSTTSGGGHTCTIDADTGVKCFGGDNANGQFGDGNTYNAGNGARRVLGVGGSGFLSGIVSVVAGTDHTCAIGSGGTVYCWGASYADQIGAGVSGRTAVPVQIRFDASTPMTGADELAAGRTHTCARFGGSVKCWGDQQFGKLGNGQTSGTQPYAIDVAGISTATSIRAGSDYTCAVLSDTTVKCWGNNGFSTLGDGTTSDRTTPVTVLASAGVPLSDVKQLALGSGFGCARLDSAKTIRCWGVLPGQNVQTNYADYTVPGLSNVTYVTSSPGNAISGQTISTVCAIDSGDLHCWGGNDFGQLSNGGYARSATPVRIEELANGTTTEVAIEVSRVCAYLPASHQVKCWGYVGTEFVPVPQEFVALAGATQVVHTLNRSSCALFPGTPTAVKCWGENRYGDLGTGDQTNYSTPQTLSFAGNPNISQLTAGASHICALTDAGLVYCWGAGSEGQLGNGSGSREYTPKLINSGSLSGVTQIAAGVAHTCALHGDGSVSCWGYNAYGNLGRGNFTSREYSPALVQDAPSTTLYGVAEIAAFNDTTCARLTDGRVKCWGYNGNQDFGADLAVAASAYPEFLKMDVSGTKVNLTGALRIAAHCALMNDHRVRCWGRNNYGQVGDGTQSTASTATLVAGLYNAISINSGENHHCAVTARDELFCWGKDEQMQAGNGGQNYLRMPGGRVSTPATGISLSPSPNSGGNLTCFFGAGSKTYCFGDNILEQAGTSRAGLYRVFGL